MPDIIACPSCGGKLRLPDELNGKKVRCPACDHIFDHYSKPQPPAAPLHAPLDLPLELTIDDPSAPAPSPPSDAPGLVGAVELTPSSDEPASESPPRRRTGKRLDRDIPNLRRLGPRRDAEPDRGTVVLSMGIISLFGLFVWCIPIIGVVLVPVCAILGLVAWIMGQSDLRKMKRGQMDDQNRGMTLAGWICGILGTSLNCLAMLSCGVFIGILWYNEVNRPPNTRPIPVRRPAPAPPLPQKKVGPPLRNKPARNQF